MTQNRVFIVTTCLLTWFAVAGCGGARAAGGGRQIADETEVATSAIDLYNYHMQQAGMAYADQNYDDAIQYYLAAAKALEDTGKTTVRQADAHFQAAEMAYQRHYRDMSIAQYEKAIGIYLRFDGNARAKAIVAYTNMGVVYKEEHNKAMARSAWQQALDVYEALPAANRNPSHLEIVNQNLRDLDQGF